MTFAQNTPDPTLAEDVRRMLDTAAAYRAALDRYALPQRYTGVNYFVQAANSPAVLAQAFDDLATEGDA